MDTEIENVHSRLCILVFPAKKALEIADLWHAEIVDHMACGSPNGW